jgi:hypothetical protein
MTSQIPLKPWIRRQRIRLYQWPDVPLQETIFPRRPHENDGRAQTRICSAARMKLQFRQLGWRYRTWRTANGIGFMWITGVSK